ncbi:TonB-dependent receptor domain-containing protein [Candidatus Pantoea multigeneris]|uniref:TonB-dependent receptor n=1 Tax=Candidatus Pantoea multigeneris TaxID=2608357 RepID=A0ABX0RID5_9GAMM|nr:TonB-dependent receptor [Pantoea multigeneris]NIF23159.1 TonB-dependent receptor [Pantoea multigeneris]
MSSIIQGLTTQRLFKTAILASAIHAACGYAATSQDLAISDKKSAGNDPVLTVTAPLEKKPGSRTVITADQLQKQGSNNFGNIMRYQPLITAPGAAGGGNTGKSGYTGDRGGFTGYNIRGLEDNRVSIDVDGIELPFATGRSSVGRAGSNTFGIGRGDYIDPYVYGQVGIVEGATDVSYKNNALGGSVSFRPKSPDDYLTPEKHTYFGYQSDYDSTDRSWHNGITAAGGDETLRGILVYSRRDGQQTRNNSGTIDAYPANWHSDAFSATGIWQPNSENQLSATLEFYHKTSHTNFDYWGTGTTSILGRENQSSNTRRWSGTLRDLWTPDNNLLIDSLETSLSFQQTQAHDDSAIPANGSSSAYNIYSDYNTKTLSLETKGEKSWAFNKFSFGMNGSTNTTERPYSQSPAQSVYSYISPPEANSRTLAFGAFVEDTMSWDLNGHTFSIIPGVRFAYQNTKAQDYSTLAGGAADLSTSDIATLYGKHFNDAQLLPSLVFQYDLTPKLMTYLQYKRGAQFPNASQLYGSWNLSSNYLSAANAQYALMGNTDLKTETSNNFEFGLKGEAVEGVAISAATFYNSYKNFIDYTRYSRSTSPEVFTDIPSNISTAYRAENRDKAYIYGFELGSKFNFGTWFPQVNGLSANLGFGYAQGASKSSYLGDKYVPLESVPPIRLITGVAYDDPEQRFGGAITATFNHGKRATYTQRQTYTNSGSSIGTTSDSYYQNIPGYALVDLTAYYRISKNVKVSGGIYNLTDRKYWDYLSNRDLESTSSKTDQNYYDSQLSMAPGRTFQLGVNVDF